MKNKKLSKIYDPSQVESKCYQNWEQKKLFAPSNNQKESFTIFLMLYLLITVLNLLDINYMIK